MLSPEKQVLVINVYEPRLLNRVNTKLPIVTFDLFLHGAIATIQVTK